MEWWDSDLKINWSQTLSRIGRVCCCPDDRCCTWRRSDKRRRDVGRWRQWRHFLLLWRLKWARRRTLDKEWSSLGFHHTSSNICSWHDKRYNFNWIATYVYGSIFHFCVFWSAYLDLFNQCKYFQNTPHLRQCMPKWQTGFWYTF